MGLIQLLNSVAVCLVLAFLGHRLAQWGVANLGRQFAGQQGETGAARQTGNPNRWLLIATWAYLVCELTFVGIYLDWLPRLGHVPSFIHLMDKIARVLSATAVSLFAVQYLIGKPKWHSQRWAAAAVVGAVFLITFNGLARLPDEIVEHSPVELRKPAMLCGAYQQLVASGSLPLNGLFGAVHGEQIDHVTALVNNPLLGVMCLHAVSLQGELLKHVTAKQFELVMSRLPEPDKWFGRYQQMTNEIRSRYQNQYKSGMDQFDSQANDGWQQIQGMRNQVNGYRAEVGRLQGDAAIQRQLSRTSPRMGRDNQSLMSELETNARRSGSWTTAAISTMFKHCDDASTLRSWGMGGTASRFENACTLKRKHGLNSSEINSLLFGSAQAAYVVEQKIALQEIGKKLRIDVPPETEISLVDQSAYRETLWHLAHQSPDYQEQFKKLVELGTERRDLSLNEFVELSSVQKGVRETLQAELTKARENSEDARKLLEDVEVPADLVFSAGIRQETDFMNRIMGPLLKTKIAKFARILTRPNEDFINDESLARKSKETLKMLIIVPLALLFSLLGAVGHIGKLVYLSLRMQAKTAQQKTLVRRLGIAIPAGTVALLLIFATLGDNDFTRSHDYQTYSRAMHEDGGFSADVTMAGLRTISMGQTNLYRLLHGM